MFALRISNHRSVRRVRSLGGAYSLLVGAALMGILYSGFVRAELDTQPYRILDWAESYFQPDDESPRALAYSRSELPSWYPRVLARLMAGKPPVYKLGQHILFRRSGQPTFLALVLRYDEAGSEGFYLYRVEVISERNVRLYLVRELADRRMTIVEPSGHDIHGDGVPVLVVSYDSGGTAFSGQGLSVYRLDRNSVDVTPNDYLRPGETVEHGPEREHLLLVSDDRWGGLFFGCGQCGPFGLVVMSWRNSHYEPACQSYPEIYQSKREETEKFQAKYNSKRSMGITNFLQYRTEIAFNLLQSGQIEQARRYYEETEQEFLRRGPHWEWWNDSLSSERKVRIFDKLLAIMRENVAPVIAAATGLTNLPCLLAGYSEDEAALDRAELMREEIMEMRR